MEITLDGPHTVVMLNGVKVTDYTEGDPVPPRKFWFEGMRGPRPNFGWIGLQNHGNYDEQKGKYENEDADVVYLQGSRHEAAGEIAGVTPGLSPASKKLPFRWKLWALAQRMVGQRREALASGF